MNFSLDKAFLALSSKIEQWILGFSANIPNMLVAFATVLIFVFLAKLAKNITSRVLMRLHQAGPVSKLISSVVNISVLMTGIFIALGILNLDKTVSSLLAGAGVIGLAIGFAFQEIASNFIAGILIAIRKPFQIGDILEVKDNLGTVSDINLRTTRLQTFDGLEIIIPNKDMFTSVITNYTTTSERRISLEVGISYAEDLRRVKKIVLEAMEPVSLRVVEKPVEVFYTGFGDSAITFEVRMWIQESDPRSSKIAIDDVVILIKEAFDKNEILIPFPIRTLDFGIKGGENLSQMLPHAPSSKN